MSIRIIGLDKALRDIDKKGDKAIKAVKSVLANEATFIEENAIRDAPATFGGQQLNIKQRINKAPKNKGLTWNVGVETQRKDFEIEAWFEFGTGLSAKSLLSGVNYDADIKAQALTFFRNGKGTIPAKPYLFPNFFIVRSRIVDKIKKSIENNIK